MNKEYPSFKAPMGGVVVIDLLMLWYFDWATWAWVVAVVLVFAVLVGWLNEALEVHRANQEYTPQRELGATGYQPAPSTYSDSDDDDLMDSGRVLWQGQRQIRFAYQSFETGDSDREVTVHKVVSKGRGNSSTYFKGFCHMRGEPRTFRLDRIKGRVTDTSTGKMATFRQLFELSSR
ncbi:WYL domain-containing protein [Pseudomonas soli]|uniref:WYL domain-containing protein n=1 Tax=Pseudomonas soli TaxID=1306993 RepID=A0A1H9M3R5_9PSED|nr:WYL domain-containing protein [Pseudomonas soli]SER18294.1 WYL domain-containing protein [Pseudomonas soli]